jgi:deoxyribose-phosphate aldolase
MSDAKKLRQVAHRLLPLLDLASLDEDENAIRTLCREARTPAGNVAAICVFPHFVSISKQFLQGTAVSIAAIAETPDTASAAIAAGADEIDLSLPEDASAVAEAVRAARAAIGRKPLLKAILETGRLAGPATIRAAARAAIEGGADFLATSSGRTQPGASLEAAAVMLAVIAEARRQRRWIGFKASGGIRTLSEAQPYLALYDRIMGEGAASAASFRLGAGSLLGDLLIALGLPGSTGESL